MKEGIKSQILWSQSPCNYITKIKNKSKIVIWKLENSFQIPALAKAMGIFSCRSNFFPTAYKLKTKDLHTMAANNWTQMKIMDI
jgi:hypothetical protein